MKKHLLIWCLLLLSSLAQGGVSREQSEWAQGHGEAGPAMEVPEWGAWMEAKETGLAVEVQGGRTGGTEITGRTVPPGRIEGQLVDAVQLYSSRRYAQALELLKKLSTEAPDNDAVWYYLALTQTVAKDLDGAEASLEKAVALDGNNYWYRVSRARMSLLRERPEQAIERFEALVKDFPDKSDAVYELLELYLKAQQYEKALGALDDIRRLRGDSEELVRTRFEVLEATGKHEEALALLEAFNKEYSSPAILSLEGQCYLNDFADSLAQARYEEALSLDSSYVPALLGLSEVHRHQRRYPEYFGTLERFFGSPDIPTSAKGMYIENLTRSIDPKILQLHREGFDSLIVTAGQTHPADTTVLQAAGRYFYTTGRVEQAGPWFKAGADAAPESLSQTVTYIQYLSLTKNWEELLARSLDGFKRFGEMAFLDYANMANFQLEDYDAIIGNAQYILSNYPKDKDLCLSALSIMGDAYHAKGNAKAAYKAYEKALRLNPDYAPVLNNYAYYLSLEGKKLKKAYTMSKKTVEAEPDNATYLDTFGWILHLMGRDLEAKPFFKHAMLYGGKESAVILEHYAVVLETLGEADTAKVYRNLAKRLPEGK